MTVPRLTMSPRDRRALQIGALVIGALLIGGRGIPAWLRWEHHAQSIAGAAALDLARQQAALIDQGAARDSLAARRKRFESLRSTWLDGDTPAAAGAELAGQISSAGEHAGVTVGALDIRVDSTSSQPFVPVRVHATATGDIQGIASLVAGIEGARLAIAVRTLSIDAADPAPLPNRAEVLRVELTVEGSWQRGSFGVSP
ncbi:MAG: type II secretion system protein GspM [Gemmatimonadaceae bacterium]